MKIAFLECAQNFGGARKAAINMAVNLRGLHETSVIDFYGSCDPFKQACDDAKVQYEVLIPSDPFYIQSASNKWTMVKNLLSFLPHMWKVNKRLRQLCEDQNIDYLCVSSFRPMLAAYLWKPKAKVIFFAHAWYIDKVIPKHEKYLLKRVPDKIVCISEATRQAIYNNEIADLEELSVVQNSIDEKMIPTEVADINRRQNEIVILHNGGFTEGKGQLFSVEMAKELKQRGVDFKLIFAGIIYKEVASQKYYDKVRELVSLYNLEGNVIFVLNKSGIFDYIRACDILVHPSATEGFPLCVLEAQILKKPVVANAVGGVIDMVLDEYTGFLPDYNNVRQYCDIIERLKNDKGLYNRISENAYNLAKTCFTKDRQINQLLNVFK